jgi:hypothetical protein
MLTRALEDKDVSLIAGALRIARDQYKVDAAAVGTPQSIAAAMAAQAEHADKLREAFEEYPRVTLTHEDV